MKRFLLATGAGIAAVAAISASAASLGSFVDPDIGARDQLVGVCSQAPIDIAYASEWSDDSQAYVVDGITATVSQDCDDLAFGFTLLDDSVAVGTGSGIVDDTEASTSISPVVVVESLDGLALVVG